MMKTRSAHLRGIAAAMVAMLWALGTGNAATGVAITSPANGAIVQGTVSITLSQGPRTKSVSVYVDSTMLATAPPDTISWDTRTVANGSHTILAQAFSSNGKLEGTDSITVSVGNSSPTPTPLPPTPVPSPTPTAAPSSTPTPAGTSSPTPAPTPAPGGHAYYVDPAGNDSNSGTSPTSPWRTVARVNAASLQPGDVVYFKAGGQWRETLAPANGGVAGSPITFTSYGSGAKPIISGSDLVTGWTLNSGSTYQAALATQPNNVYVDGGPGWGLTHAGAVSSMPAGSWYWSASLLYVRLADGSSPAAHAVEAATRVYGFKVNTGAGSSFSYITIDGLEFQRTGGYGIYFHDYASVGQPGLAGIVIENNTVTQTGTGTVDGGQYYNAVHFLDETHWTDNARIINNTISYCGGHNCLEAQDGNNVEVAGNDVSYYNHNGIDTKGASGILIHGNYVHDRPSMGAAFYIEDTTAYNADVTWEQNTIYNVSNGFQCAGGAASVHVSCTVHNNSMLNAGTGIFLGPSDTDTVSINVKNNITYGSGISFENDDGKGTYSIDYNDWGPSPRLMLGGTSYSFSQWQALGGHSHDIASNPLWVSAPSNFSLQAASPCIDAGVDVGLPYSGAAPDMGAIEWQAGGPSPTPSPGGNPTPTPAPTASATPAPTPTPAAAVTISAPAAGATVSGTASISALVDSQVSWINVFIDSTYLASSPPYTFSWNSTTATNGSHIVMAQAKNSSGTVIGTDSISVNVQNGASTPTPVPTSTPRPVATPTPAPLSFSHVFVVVEENHSYTDVVGNTASMPYLNGLISKYGLATQYYANTHPSLPNYLWLTAGSADGITSDVCGVTVSADNVVRELGAAGLSWKAYEEGLPSVGYLGCSSGEYVEKHDPFAYFSDVINSGAEQQNIVPFSHFAVDLANGTLPRYSFITPNLLDDAHDGTLAQADGWLRSNIAPLLSAPMFQPGGTGVLIIVFDEGTDNTNGGGRVAWVVVSPLAKAGYRSTTFYQHQSTLRLMLEGLGVTKLPGAAASAPDMSEFFN